MNILFLTISKINSIEDRAIYPDLLRKFRDEGHSITIVTPLERRHRKKTYLLKENRSKILKVWSPNIQKTNILEKGISIILIEFLFKIAVNKYLKNQQFDLILYSTPPITFTKLISELKITNQAKTYLLLKDIFPQNAVDLKIIRKNSILYNYFRKKEIDLYKISDWIGCMSEANRKYILYNNPELSELKVEINPNSVYLEENISYNNPSTFFQKKIPNNKTIFLYGGNLGKPQGIDFMLEIIKASTNNLKAFFVIVGSGTESKRVKKWFNRNQPQNALFIEELPQNDYRSLLKQSHVGLVFLHPDFTIPNYPSRILSYMENKLPILLATDLNTDVGIEAEKYNYGFWCESGNLREFLKSVELFCDNLELRNEMGNNGYERLKNDFSVDYSYSQICNHLN